MNPLQKNLLASHKQYAKLYDFSPNPYVTIDKTCHIQKINLAAENLLGIDQSIRSKASFLNFISCTNQDFFKNQLQAVFLTHTPLQCELELLQKNNKPCDVCLKMVFLEEKQMVLITIIEVTQQAQDSMKHIESARVNAEHMKVVSEMLSALSHEMNQPLTAISLYSYICLKQIENNAFNATNISRELKQIHTLCQHASNILRRMTKSIQNDELFL